MTRLPQVLNFAPALLAIILASLVLGAATARASTTFTVQISANPDDAEQDSGGGMSLNNSKLELGQKLWVGFRFANVHIPQGATITTAYLRLRAADSNTEATNLTIFGQAADTASSFSGGSNNISNRPRTSASVNWNPVPNWSSGTTYNTPEIKTILQEIVDRSGWSHGSSLAILVRSNNANGKRLVVARLGAAPIPAILHIEYTLAAPVGHWKLNHSSGTTATDSSVFARHGTVSGPANWSTQCNGTGAFNFNGSTNYVSVSNASHLQPSKALTIAGWVCGDTWGTDTEVDIVLRKGEDNPNNWQLAISDGRVELLLDGNDAAGFRGNTVLVPGVWYHVAATWDGSSVRIYVNGQLDNTPASRSGTIGTDTRPVYLGGRPGTDLFDGLLQDVRLYNRALTQAEIARLAGLIAHWKLTETSGTSAADSSLVANNGTYLNGVALNGVGPYPGVGAVAATFDGANDYVAVPNESLYDVTEQITIAGWFKVGVFDKTWQAIIAKGDSAWRLSRMANTNTLHFACTGVSPDQVNGSIDVNDGKWHHVACVYNGTTMSLYVDGVLDASVNASGSISTNNYAVWIGANEQMLGRNFNGLLHDMRVYSRALCPTEIVELYGLVAHWKLDEAGGSTAWDAVGGNNGTYQNNVTTGAGALPLYTGNTAAQFGGGNNDRVQVPAFDVTGSGITLLAWFKPSTLGDDRFVSKASGVNAAGHLWALGINGNTQMRALVQINGTTRELTPTVSTLSAGTWYLAALTYDGTTMRVFLNGSQVGSGAWSGSVSTSSSVAVALGNQPSGAGNRAFPGVLDDVRVYNRPLWPSDIQAFYEAASGGSTPGVRIIRWVEIQ